MRNRKILNDLNNALIPAIGCTDPVSVSYSASLARNVNPGTNLEKISVRLNGALYKNISAVYIPNTDMFGIENAATLGAMINLPNLKMELLDKVTPEIINETKRIVISKKVHYEVVDKKYLFIEVEILTEKGTSTAIISHNYTHVELVKYNEVTIYEDRVKEVLNSELESYTVDEIIKFAKTIPINDLYFVKKAIEMNTRFYEQKSLSKHKIGIGNRLNQASKGNLWLDILSITSEASDARMAGSSLAVMSNSGSGNQGLLSLLPIILMSKELKIDEHECLRACALSASVLMSIKQKFGTMSGMCSAVVSSCGTAAGLTYLQTKDDNRIKLSIQNVIANISGIYCDGAKASCALKISTCAFAALTASSLAIHDEGVNGLSGIVEDNVDDTINNLSILSQISKGETDSRIISMISNKKNCFAF